MQTALDAESFDPDEKRYGGAKVSLMQDVSAAQGWTFVGLQETRLRGTIQSGTGSDHGNLGVAL